MFNRLGRASCIGALVQFATKHPGISVRHPVLSHATTAEVRVGHDDWRHWLRSLAQGGKRLREAAGRALGSSRRRRPRSVAVDLRCGTTTCRSTPGSFGIWIATSARLGL